jgi:hypothetical protein
MNRFEESSLSNEQLASKLIAEHPSTRWGGPKLWEDIDADYMRAIEAKKQEVARLAKQPAGQFGNATPETYNYAFIDELTGNSVPVTGFKETRTLPLETPAAFQHGADKKRYESDVKNFMETNKLGTVEDGSIVFADNVYQADIEKALRVVNTGTLPTAHQQNWKGYLMKSLKEGDRGAREAGERISFNEIATPGADYNQAMRDLEKLHSNRQILNYASGGFGFGTPPNRYGLFSSFNKESRPAIGLYDFDFEVMPRNIARGAGNAYDRKEELADYAEKMVALGKMSYGQAAKFIEENADIGPLPLTIGE